MRVLQPRETIGSNVAVSREGVKISHKKWKENRAKEEKKPRKRLKTGLDQIVFHTDA